MDWTDPTVSGSTKEREVEMSSLTTGFAAWMDKRATNAEGEAVLGSEGLYGKRSRRSDSEDETQKSPVAIPWILLNEPSMACWLWEAPPRVLSMRPL